MQNDPRECNPEARQEACEAIDGFCRWHTLAKADGVLDGDIPLVDGSVFWATRVKQHLVIAAQADEDGREKLGLPSDWLFSYDLERAVARLDDLHGFMISDRVTKYYHNKPLEQVRIALLPRALSLHARCALLRAGMPAPPAPCARRHACACPSQVMDTLKHLDGHRASLEMLVKMLPPARKRQRGAHEGSHSYAVTKPSTEEE